MHVCVDLVLGWLLHLVTRCFSLDLFRKDELRQDRRVQRVGGNVAQYMERLEQYFLANDVKEAAKQWTISLSVCGSKTYALARDLLQSPKAAETTYKNIVDELSTKHFAPKPNEIVERFKFHSRKRKEGEGVATYLAGLRKHCNVGETLPEMLRDRL